MIPLQLFTAAGRGCLVRLPSPSLSAVVVVGCCEGVLISNTLNTHHITYIQNVTKSYPFSTQHFWNSAVIILLSVRCYRVHCS